MVALSFAIPLILTQLTFKHHHNNISCHVQNSTNVNLGKENEECQREITRFQAKFNNCDQKYQDIQKSYDRVLTETLELKEQLNKMKMTNEYLLMKAADEGAVYIVEALLNLNTSVLGRWQTTPLLVAARKGRYAIVKMLLDAGADIDKRNNQGNTPLIEAVHNNQLSVCSLLLNHGANVNVSDTHKNTPLHYAAMFGYLPVVQLLVMHGANVTAINENGRTPMEEAVRNIQINVVEWLREEKIKNATNPRKAAIDIDNESVELFIELARDGNISAVNFLLNHGMDASAQDWRRRTALHYAALNGHSEVVKLLLAAGANMEARNRDGNTPLIWAAHNNHLEVCRLLLEQGANVNVSDVHRNSPLHYAAMFGYLPIVKLLVSYGADTTVQNNKQRTPLEEAERTGERTVAVWLRSPEILTLAEITVTVIPTTEVYNNTIEINSIEGASVEHFMDLASIGNVSALHLLLNHGMNASAQDSRKRTALHYAANNGHLEAVKLLLDAGASMETRNPDGNTPLIWAAHNNHLEVCRLLLERGANVNVSDVHRNTPLHYAAMFGYLSIVKLLVSYGADTTVQNNKQRTPLEEAEEAGEMLVEDWLSSVISLTKPTTAVYNSTTNMYFTSMEVSTEKKNEVNPSQSTYGEYYDYYEDNYDF